MARKSELEEYLPKCRSWHRIERFDEIDESHVGFQVVFLSLPQRIDDCKSSIAVNQLTHRNKNEAKETPI